MSQLLCPVMVGRSGELDAVVDRLGATTGGAVFVTGEAGIGKSRLVRAVVEEARLRGWLVLTGRAVPSRQPVPYRPFVEALLAACRHTLLPDAAQLIPYRPALGRLFPEWLRPELAASVESSVVLGEGILRMLDVLRSDGHRNGVLLALEDLHWADPESLAVLEYLVDHVVEERLLCLGTVRSGTSVGSGLVGELVARRSAALVDLRRLSRAEVAVMAQGCLSMTFLPDGLEELLDRAEGVPFLVEELLAASADNGGLMRTDAGWKGVVNGPHVPRTLTDSVMQRITVLDTTDRDIPRAAALLGRRFDLGVLSATLGKDPGAVSDVLNQLVAGQVLVIDAAGFKFRHALTRDAVLAGLDPHHRAALAARVRSVMEELHPGLPDPWCQLAAELSQLAGDIGDAARLLFTVGQRAMAGGALATAGAVSSEARLLAIAGSPLALAIDELRVEIAATVGDSDAAFEIGDPLISMLTDPAARVRLHLLLAQAAGAATRWEAAQKQINMARDLVADTTDINLARIEALAAHLYLGTDDQISAGTAALQALEIAERRDVPDAACQSLEVLGRIARTTDLARAETAFERELEIASDHGLTIWQVRATHELGTIDLMRRGHTDRLSTARVLAAESGALSTAAIVDIQLAAACYLRFDVPGCLAAARRSAQAARRWDLQLPLVAALLFEARAHAISGERSAMELTIAEALAVNRTEPEPRASAEAARGLYWLLHEDRRRAMDAYENAFTIVRTSGVSSGSYSHDWAFLRTALDLDGAAALAEVAAITPTGARWSEAALGYAEAIDAGRKGSGDDAVQLFASARAKILEGDGWSAQRHLFERWVAENALKDGWGSPVEWLADAAAFFNKNRQPYVERACRSLLHQVGARLPRRTHGRRTVPPALAKFGITEREVEVLALASEGLTNKEIAERLFISVRTVDKHVERILQKTGKTSRTELRALST